MTQQPKRIPLARSDFENWLRLNRPQFGAFHDKVTDQFGFYSKARGRAESFRGFSSWQEAKDYLVGNS